MTYLDQFDTTDHIAKLLQDDIEVIVNDNSYGVSVFFKGDYDSTKGTLSNIELSVMNILDCYGKNYLYPSQIDDSEGAIQAMIDELASDEESLLVELNLI